MTTPRHDDWLALPMPTDGSSQDSTSLHAMLTERIAQRYLCFDVTPDFWEKKKQRLAERHGLTYPP